VPYLSAIRLIHGSAIFDFNENESEAVRDSHASLQWAVLLFNVFSDCSAH